MNPVAWFVPGLRASGLTFFFGLIVYLVIDGARLYAAAKEMVDVPGYVWLAGFAVIFLLLVFLHFNRLNDAGKGWAWLFLPLGLGLLAKGIGSFTGLMIGSFGLMGQYAEEQGTDLQSVAQDPAFQEQFQVWLESDPERVMHIASLTIWPSFIAFWVVVVLFGLWFMSMKRQQG